VRPVVVIIVFPFPQHVIKQVDVLGNAIFIEELVKLLLEKTVGLTIK
jgi:hypothetical protein